MESRTSSTEVPAFETDVAGPFGSPPGDDIDRNGGGDGGRGASDGVVVLPWWQHPVNILTMLVTVAILAGMVGWMVGDTGADIEHNDVDTGFLQDMREHHEQAVLMSFVYRTRPDAHPGLRTIARSIVVGQSLEVGRMIQLLRSFGESEIRDDDVSMLWMGMSATPGQMPGMATEDELDELAAATGGEADELFVSLMTEHHLGGIEMAEFAAENAESSEVIAMASSMAQGQRGEIAEMEGVLERSQAGSADS
jgi:uncharacterized protein (DUF305 family)